MTDGLYISDSHIRFYSSDQEPVKRFTVLNFNHDVGVHYVVQTTGPERYMVTPREGSIKPKCKVDIEVIHRDVCVTNEGIKDIIKLFFSAVINQKKESLGSLEVSLILLPDNKTPPPPSGDVAPPQHLGMSRRSPGATLSGATASLMTEKTPFPPRVRAAEANILFFLLPIAVIGVVLMLPDVVTVSDQSWSLELATSTRNTLIFILGILVTLLYQRVVREHR